MKDSLIKFGAKIDTVGNAATDNDLKGNVENIIIGIIGVLGVACVIVMIVGGVGYMSSAGDSGKVEKAKKTILYGLIGLVVSALAFAITNFAIGIITGSNSTPTCPDGQVWDAKTETCVIKK